MKNKLILLLTIFLIGLFGCSNNTVEELTKEEQEALYREEVRKKLDEEELAKNHNGAEFDAFL